MINVCKMKPLNFGALENLTAYMDFLYYNTNFKKLQISKANAQLPRLAAAQLKM